MLCIQMLTPSIKQNCTVMFACNLFLTLTFTHTQSCKLFGVAEENQKTASGSKMALFVIKLKRQYYKKHTFAKLNCEPSTMSLDSFNAIIHLYFINFAGPNWDRLQRTNGQWQFCPIEAKYQQQIWSSTWFNLKWNLWREREEATVLTQNLRVWYTPIIPN